MDPWTGTPEPVSECNKPQGLCENTVMCRDRMCTSVAKSNFGKVKIVIEGSVWSVFTWVLNKILRNSVIVKHLAGKRLAGQDGNPGCTPPGLTASQ